MPVEIDGIRFLTATEVQAAVGISRQTLWRWRQEGQVPAGHRYRGRQVVFTPQEVAAIREHAQRIDPIDELGNKQFRLFNGNGKPTGGSS